MKKFPIHSIGIDQGDDVLFSDYQDGGDMWTGSGPRKRRHSLIFKEPFKSVPVVHCSMSMWDMDSSKNARADVSAENVTVSGFDVVFRTWGDTKVARARVRWLAIGGVDSEEDWKLY